MRSIQYKSKDTKYINNYWLLYWILSIKKAVYLQSCFIEQFFIFKFINLSMD